MPGQSYTLTITHKGNLSGTKQDYALLLSGIGGKAYCASAATSNADTKISRVQLGTINQAGAGGCTTYSDFFVGNHDRRGRAATAADDSARHLRGDPETRWSKPLPTGTKTAVSTTPAKPLATSNVLTNTATFSTTVAVPTTVRYPQFIRLRIVATETNDAATVNACGTFANGETQDYVLNVVQTTNDVGAAELVSPDLNFCAQTGSDLTVAVRIHNYGTAIQRNVPVTVKIADAGNAEIATLTGTVAAVTAFRESLLTLRVPATVSLLSGQTYRFAITTGLPTDQNADNNTIIVTRTTAPAPTNGLFSATRCGSDTAIALRNAGDGTAYWYDAPTGGNLLAAGNLVGVKTLPASGQFYAVLNAFSGTIGPADKRAFGGGSYAGNFGPAPLVSTQVPLLIESARLYIGTAGKLTFTVRKFDNTAISSVTLDVLPTRNQSLTATTNGQLVDDPDDPGAVYALNLRIPTPGDYKNHD